MESLLGQFFSNEVGKMPPFIDGIDDFVHVKIIRLKGKLDHSTSMQMSYFFEKAKESPVRLDKSVLLDFRKVETVETSAIAQLLKVLTVLKKKKYHLGLFNVPENMLGMLEIIKLDHVFQIFDTKTKAFEEVVKWSKDW